MHRSQRGSRVSGLDDPNPLFGSPELSSSGDEATSGRSTLVDGAETIRRQLGVFRSGLLYLGVPEPAERAPRGI